MLKLQGTLLKRVYAVHACSKPLVLHVPAYCSVLQHKIFVLKYALQESNMTQHCLAIYVRLQHGTRPVLHCSTCNVCQHTVTLAYAASLAEQYCQP